MLLLMIDYRKRWGSMPYLIVQASRSDRRGDTHHDFVVEGTIDRSTTDCYSLENKDSSIEQ